MAGGRPPTSLHGRLFGGDTLYEVLAEIARSKKPTYAVPLAAELGRTTKQTRDELAKLQQLHILDEIAREGKAHLLGPASNPLAKAILQLPQLLVAELGPYDH
jgi:hypothetical protein